MEITWANVAPATVPIESPAATAKPKIRSQEPMITFPKVAAAAIGIMMAVVVEQSKETATNDNGITTVAGASVPAATNTVQTQGDLSTAFTSTGTCTNSY